MRENRQVYREENPFIKLNLEAVEHLDETLWEISLASMNFWLTNMAPGQIILSSNSSSMQYLQHKIRFKAYFVRRISVA